MRSCSRYLLLIVTAWVVSTVGMGCGGGGKDPKAYVPSSADAQQALTMSLDAWKASAAHDPVGKLASGVKVKAIDLDWAEGKKLASYSGLKEIPGAGVGPKNFSVKLKYQEGPEIDATYLVVGIDPLQVFRDKDYERYFGMDK